MYLALSNARYEHTQIRTACLGLFHMDNGNTGLPTREAFRNSDSLLDKLRLLCKRAVLARRLKANFPHSHRY